MESNKVKGDCFENTMNALTNKSSLKWIFVGGKGGVGKTVCSCALAIQLAKTKESVLVVSTGPDHNLSDVFEQKILGVPTKVNGYRNLFALEVSNSTFVIGNAVQEVGEEDSVIQDHVNGSNAEKNEADLENLGDSEELGENEVVAAKLMKDEANLALKGQSEVVASCSYAVEGENENNEVKEDKGNVSDGGHETSDKDESSEENDVAKLLHFNQEVGKIMLSMNNSVEIYCFVETLSIVSELDFSVVVFDTAPSIYTIKLLEYMKASEKGFQRLEQIKSEACDKFFTHANDFLSEFDFEEPQQASLFAIAAINRRLADPDSTAFVNVCVPEYLTVRHTQNMCEELKNLGIDCQNIIVNQLLTSVENSCPLYKARYNLQQQNLDTIFAHFKHSQIAKLPLLVKELRGSKSIEEFSEHLVFISN